MISNFYLLTTRFPSFQVLGLGQVIRLSLQVEFNNLFNLFSDGFNCRGVMVRKKTEICNIPELTEGHFFKNLAPTANLCWQHDVWSWWNQGVKFTNDDSSETVFNINDNDCRILFIRVRYHCWLLLKMSQMKISLSFNRVTASTAVQFSVYMMIFGAMVAASQDLAFNLMGYMFLFMNDIFTATNGVYLKKKLDAKELGTNGLLFYNSLFMIPPALLAAGWTGDLAKVVSFSFQIQFP